MEEVRKLLKEIYHLDELLTEDIKFGGFEGNQKTYSYSIKLCDYIDIATKKGDYNGMIKITNNVQVEDPQKKNISTIDYTPTRPQKTPEYSTILDENIAPTIFLK